MPVRLETLWAATLLILGLATSAHVVLNKRDVRAAAGWVGLVLLVPLVGPMLYLLLGVNRIRRRAGLVRAGIKRYEHASPLRTSPQALERALPALDLHLAGIARTTERTGRWPLSPGNRVTPLFDGDEAYPEMLRCIAAASRSVVLSTYIFDDDATGKRFVDELARAQARGVEVRVLIDDAGARYSFPPVDRALRARGVRVARFLRVSMPWFTAYANLRNHRKIMVVDGCVGFTGGLNIRHSCVLQAGLANATRDLHFRVQGPVVTTLMDVFAADWTFATGESLADATFFSALGSCGPTTARVISDGPDDDLDCMRWALHGALATARRSVRVVTPYFLPDEPLVTALNAAALRGVSIDVVLPERGNLRFVDWAMRGELWKLMPHGCRIWLSPPPFDHSKLMTVDGAWILFGSANWDPRSLRLNFELGLECYDRALAARLDEWLDARIARARRLLAAELQHAAWPVRLRNAAARLLAPYL